MTKLDLIKRLARRKRLPKTRAQALVDELFRCIEESLRRGERVEVRGLGTFEVRSYGAYLGRNPRTGEAVEVSPKRIPFFRAGHEITHRLNERWTRTQELPAVDERPGVARPALSDVAASAS